MLHTIEKNGLTILQSDLISGGAAHGFSTRKGGVSPAPWDSLNLGISRGDDMANVRENYRRFCAAVGVDDKNVVLSQQTHGDTVRRVTVEDRGKGLWRDRDYTGVDGLITDVPHTPLVIFSADCNVILLYDPVRKAIGACHAGWRGTASGIAAKTVREMTNAYGCEPKNIRAAIGPAIGQCCFETDSDVPDALRAALGNAVEPYMDWNGRKWHIDLRAINALWLRRCGVTAVDVSDLCTMCRQDWFWSHRAVGNDRGAQVALISLEDGL